MRLMESKDRDIAVMHRHGLHMRPPEPGEWETDEPRSEASGGVGRLATLGLALVVGYVVALSLPDIRRYLRIRRM